MILYSGELRVALATEHIPLAQVSQTVTRELLQSKLAILRDSLVRDFGIDKPRIAVLGLNPHAGDDGHIGQEELQVIRPLVESLYNQGHLVFGPYSADAFFARQAWKEFDAVLAMYHDQGLIPFKTIAAGEGVNYTAGLPAIRTSPDHGTAFDIAGKNMADPGSFREAVYQCIDLIRQRKTHAENTANPLRRHKSEKERSRDSEAS
jgi:4-hydroxythreonine-4-phosphate dehydrogenase